MSAAVVPEPVITVRPVETVAEYRACQEIQRRAWGITEDGYVVPVATMISVQHAGGLVLGAFRGERLIGFAFGYLGRVRGQWALYSQLAGVDPTVQAAGVGGKLKAAQRAWAKAQGLALVAWSFDALQAGNANFNLHRLGAFCRTYQVNYFGERTDALNAGLDTDRLLAEWPVDDQPRRWQDDELLIEIPSDLATLKAQDPHQARERQRCVRAAFQQAFADGYAAMDFRREPAAGAVRACYVLRRPATALDLHLATPGRVRALLVEMKESLHSLFGGRLKGLYLFGSYARGDEREDSDVDVLVVLDRVEDYGAEHNRTSQLVAELCLAHAVLINEYVVTEAEWAAGDSMFLRNAREDAVPV